MISLYPQAFQRTVTSLCDKSCSSQEVKEAAVQVEEPTSPQPSQAEIMRLERLLFCLSTKPETLNSHWPHPKKQMHTLDPAP